MSNNLYQAPKKVEPGEPLPSEQSGWVWILFVFTGRVPRSVFWAGMVVLAIALISLYSFAWGLGSEGNRGLGSLVASFFVFTIFFPLLWASVAIQVKRWHDLDKSAWWFFILLIPVIGWLWVIVALGFMPGTPGPNRYGPPRLRRRT